MIDRPGHAGRVRAGGALRSVAVPGPAVLYIVTAASHQGRAAGLASVLGIPRRHARAPRCRRRRPLGDPRLVGEAFTVVKLARRALPDRGSGSGRSSAGAGAEPNGQRTRRAAARRDFAEGVVVNVLNPKTALFFLAFLPQFVDPDGPSVLQILVLGGIFMVLGLVTDSIWALPRARRAETLRRSRRWALGTALRVGTSSSGLGAAHGADRIHRRRRLRLAPPRGPRQARAGA